MIPMFGPPPAPEEIVAAEKRQAERRLAASRKVNAGIPHLRDAQRSLREAAALGLGGARFDKAQKHIAVLIEEAETDLVRNV